MCEVGSLSVLLLSPGPVRAKPRSFRHPALGTNARATEPPQQLPCITNTMSHDQNGAPAPKADADFAEVGHLSLSSKPASNGYDRQ
jgi:hypothetical protein